jgi:hypothetical protein
MDAVTQTATAAARPRLNGQDNNKVDLCIKAGML